jgi:hypothetical protein
MKPSAANKPSKRKLLIWDMERDEENRELRYIDPCEDEDGYGEP